MQRIKNWKNPECLQTHTTQWLNDIKYGQIKTERGWTTFCQTESKIKRCQQRLNQGFEYLVLCTIYSTLCKQQYG